MFSIMLSIIPSRNPGKIIFRNVINYNFQKCQQLKSWKYNLPKCQQFTFPECWQLQFPEILAIIISEMLAIIFVRNAGDRCQHLCFQKWRRMLTIRICLKCQQLYFTEMLTVIICRNPGNMISEKLAIIVSRNTGNYNCPKCQQSYFQKYWRHMLEIVFFFCFENGG